MKSTKNYPFHSTGQFRNVVKNIKTSSQFKGLDEQGSPIIDKDSPAPVINYIGTVKTHGTNASIILSEDGTISFHSKNNLLGYVDTQGEFHLESDNAGFAQTMYSRMQGVDKVTEDTKDLLGDKLKYPLKISGEWIGQGVQKGVGVSYLPQRTLIIFGVKNGETDQTIKQGWLPLKLTKGICSNDHYIYNVMQFTTYELTIDFNNPEYSQNVLVDNTNKVEEECPVAKTLGVTENLIGEGIVYQPTFAEHCWDSGNWFKVKGEKHSVSKVKTLAAVCPEKLESIQKFVDYAATDNRLEQGLQEVGLDQKLVGTFIGWVNRDINKEEGDVLEANNLSMKDVGKQVSDIARKYYLDKLNSDF